MMNEDKLMSQQPTSEAKSPRGLIITGMVGAGIAALCCFTPILVGLLAVLGFGALTGYLDFVLLPALVFFLCLLAYGLAKQRKGETSCCAEPLLNKGEKDGEKHS